MKPTYIVTINSRTLNTCHQIEKELQLNEQKNYLFSLDHLGILAVQGEQAINFLQGQLTCDVSVLSDIKMAQGALCNLKGRILALLDVLYWNGVQLMLPKDLMEPTVNSLSKSALLSRLHLQENTNVSVFGFYHQNKDDLTPYLSPLPDSPYNQIVTESACCYYLGQGFFVLIVLNEVISELIKPFMQQDQLLGSLTWHTLRMYHQQINIYPESRGLFMPHRLQLHETPYLSFTKGCYKGQEIIARTQYRATLKHEMRLYRINAKHKIYSGQRLFQPDTDREIGELIDYSVLGKNQFLIWVSILKEWGNEVLFSGHEKNTHLEA